MTTVIEGDGTAEVRWLEWLESRPWPALDVEGVAGRRVVVFAAHPDDETLGVGGLLVRLAAIGCPLVFVWASDGEASHPASTVYSPLELGQRRRAEVDAALAVLGIRPADIHHLGLPDGALTSHGGELASAFARVTDADDLVIAPWAFDGHPDHEAVGHAAAESAATAWQYPIWMWHWAEPADRRVPWHRFRSVTIANRSLKADAISRFETQVLPIGPDAADGAILPPHVLARFNRRVEWIIA